jgi:hypothetical protein
MQARIGVAVMVAAVRVRSAHDARTPVHIVMAR